MKKVYCLILLALMYAGVVLGQENKEVAVLQPRVIGGGTVSTNDKLIISSSMKKAFTQIDGYEAYTRTAQSLIEVEQAFQRSGAVDENQIKAAGKQAGVAYICVFTLSKENNELVVNSDIISVVSGKITNSDFIVLLDVADRNDVMKQCQALAYNLLGVSGGSTNSTPIRKPVTNSGKNLSFTANGATFEMIFVEGGTFTIGCTSEQGSDCDDDERPTHQVTLSDYYIDKYEVTQKLWQAVMGSNPSNWKGDNLPVEMVSYADCEEFCSKLNKLLSNQLPEGSKFRMPTEAQWEYAARGGKKSKSNKYSGSDYLSEVAWYIDNSGSKTHEVGLKDKNELGIYDMSGNVWEWCSDWKGAYSSSSVTNPKGPGSGSNRVLRGGSWIYYAQSCRVSNRSNDAPGDRVNSIGFRLVLVP